MSSRFVRGWKASPSKLLELVGSKTLSPADVLASKSNARSRKDVFMTLGEGDEREDVATGKLLAVEALTCLLEGRPKRASAYEYARVTELVLNHAARPLAPSESREIFLGYTYHVPHDEFGCWNPSLRALELPKLAKLWATQNFAFPWSRRPELIGWPLWTVFDARSLPLLSAELATVTRRRLDALPAKLLTDEPAHADDARGELWQGLKRLRDWVTEAQAPEPKETLGCATTGNSLILSMDGDQ